MLFRSHEVALGDDHVHVLERLVAVRIALRHVVQDDDRVIGPALQPGETFKAVAIGQSFSDQAAWVITPWMTRVKLDDLDYVPETEAAA